MPRLNSKRISFNTKREHGGNEVVEQFKITRFAESGEDMHRLQSQFIQVSDTGAADSLNTVLHNLNRVPRGFRIVNSAVASASAMTWYRLATDDPWTDRLLTFRLWGTTSARILLEVF